MNLLDTSLQVELHVTSIRCISRAALLPFEMIDASRSEVGGTLTKL